MRQRIAPLAAALVLTACHNTADAPGDAPVVNPNFQQWKLPQRLREISGLALTADNRLLAVTDEEAIVYEIDYEKGAVTKTFALGSPVARDDFEGIAVVDETVWLMTSDGRLFASPEGNDGEHVTFVQYDTGAGDYCELEGLAADQQSQALLLACKQTVSARDELKVFQVPLADGRPADLTATDIPEASIAARIGRKHVRPSGIAIDPGSGNWVLVAANHAALITVASDGALIDAIILPGKRRHRQAEGIAITADGRLVIADEGGDGRARLAVYAWTSAGIGPERQQ